MSDLKLQILEQIKVAMRAKDRKRLGVLRLVSSAMKQREVDERIELTDIDVLAVLDKMVKQRRESLDQYNKAGREDLAAQESYELELLAEFLPEPLSADEMKALITQAISDTNASSIRDMGAVMANVKAAAEGRADMKLVSAAVRDQLNS